MRALGAGGLTVGLLATLPVLGQEPSSNLQLSAFGTVGLARTDNDQVGFRREASQFEGIYSKPSFQTDTRLGVQLSAKLSPTLLASVQAVWKYGVTGSYELTVPWASLAWSPSPGLLIRGGILNFNDLPTGDNFDVGHTYLWVRPPVEVFNSSLNSMKGISVSRTFQAGPEATLEANAFYGFQTGRAPIDHVGPWSFDGSPVYGATVRLLTGPFRWRVGGGSIRFNHNLPEPIPTIKGILLGFAASLPEPRLETAAADLDARGVKFWSIYSDVVWEKGPSQFQGLIARADSSTFTAPVNWYGYASFGYRLGPVVPYAMFARDAMSQPRPLDLGALRTVTGPTAPLARTIAADMDTLIQSRQINRNTWTAGVRWDFSRDADLKFQVDTLHSKAGTGLFYVPANPSPWNGRMTVVSLTLDFILGGGK